MRLPSLILSSLLLLNGCASIFRVNDDNEENAVYRGVYSSTKLDFEVLSSAANDNGGNWMSGIPALLSPFAIIDIPFSLITDTITFPYDAYQHSYHSKYIEFWEGVATTKDTSIPMSKYLEYYTHVGAIVVKKQSRHEINENLLKLYFDVATTDNSEVDISRSIINTIIKESQNHKNLAAIRDYVCDVASTNISNKKFNGVFLPMLNSDMYTSECVDMLALAGLDCRYLVTSKNLSEKYVRQCYQQEPEIYGAQLARARSAPGEIQKQVFEFEHNKIIDKYGVLENVQRPLLTNLLYIARNTKDISLIDKIYALGNKHLNKSLTYNSAVPFKYKENDHDFLIRTVRENGTSKDIILKLIHKHPGKDQFMNEVAVGKRVDIDIYNALLSSVPDNNKATILNKIVSNKYLLNDEIYYQMLSVDGIQDLLSARSYQKILKVTEPVVSEIYDFGVVEFVESAGDVDVLESVKKLPGYQPPGQWVVTHHTNKIPKTLGVKFGILYKLSQELSDTSYIISTDIIYPQGGLKNPAKMGYQKAMPTREETITSGDGYVEYVHLDKPWMLKSGEWIIQISYKGKLVIEKSFFIDDI